MLTGLQQRIAKTVAGLPEAEGFALAGGGALILQQLIDRETQDLDYFATSQDAVETLAPVLVQALRTEGLQVRHVRSSPGFLRIEVRDDQAVCEVDLAHDRRLVPADASPMGPVLGKDELAAYKVLALFRRARGRDFVDVHALLDHYEPQRLIELAAAKDPMFRVDRFVEAIDALDRLPREDFPTSDDSFADLRARFVAWRGDLLHQPAYPPGSGQTEVGTP